MIRGPPRSTPTDALLPLTTRVLSVQREPADRGLAPLDGYRYNNGGWAHDVGGRMPGCSGELWIPCMAGYGGITMLILPNGSAYYYFSDDDTYLWMDAAQAAHGIRSLCQ